MGRAIIHMTGEEDRLRNSSCFSSWQVRLSAPHCLSWAHGRSHCLPYVHFANFNCPSRALYTAGQFACHVHNGGSHYLPFLLGQFTLLYMSNCMLCALWQVTLHIVGTMSCYTACLVHYGRGSECLPCALWQFRLPATYTVAGQIA